MNKKFNHTKEKSIKLYYFQYNGRALISKAILHYLRLPFDCITFSENEWHLQKKSGKFEFQQLPAIEISNKIYVQSTAIEVYLARKYNLMGETIEDEYSILSLICSKNDLINYLRPLVRPDLEMTEFEKLTFLDEILPFYLKQYEKRYISSRGKNFICDKITLADIVITILIYYIFLLDEKRSSLFKPIILINAPNLLNFVQKFYKKEMKNFFDIHYNFDYEF